MWTQHYVEFADDRRNAISKWTHPWPYFMRAYTWQFSYTIAFVWNVVDKTSRNRVSANQICPGFVFQIVNANHTFSLAAKHYVCQFRSTTTLINETLVILNATTYCTRTTHHIGIIISILYTNTVFIGVFLFNFRELFRRDRERKRFKRNISVFFFGKLFILFCSLFEILVFYFIERSWNGFFS